MYLAKFIPGRKDPIVTEVEDYVEIAGVRYPREPFARLLPEGRGAAALRSTRVDAIASAKCKLEEEQMRRERIEERAKLKC